MIKRLVSMILCIFALCQMVCVDSYAFDWPWSQIKSQQNSADQKNKCGNFEDIEYLKNKCLKKLKNGKGFCRQLNIGPQCQTDLWFWDYVQIKEALSNLRKCSLNMESTIVDEIILNVADTIKALFKTDSEMAKETSKYWLNHSLIINNSKSKSFFGYLARDFSDFCKCCFVKPFGAIHRCMMNEDVPRYSMAFDKILMGVMDLAWVHGDTVFLKSNYAQPPTKDYGEHVNFIKQGIYYDKNTKEICKSMFGKLEEMLTNIEKGNVC